MKINADNEPSRLSAILHGRHAAWQQILSSCCGMDELHQTIKVLCTFRHLETALLAGRQLNENGIEPSGDVDREQMRFSRSMCGVSDLGVLCRS